MPTQEQAGCDQDKRYGDTHCNIAPSDHPVEEVGVNIVPEPGDEFFKVLLQALILGLKTFPVQHPVTGQVSRQYQEGFKEGEKEGCNNHNSHIKHHFHPGSCQKEKGRKSNNGGCHRCQYRRSYLHGAIHCSMHGAFTLFEVEVDIFCDDNPVIHQDPDHQDHAEKRLQVDGDPYKMSRNKHGQKAERNTPAIPIGIA